MARLASACGFDGCERPVHARGLCSACYQREIYRRNPENKRREALLKYHRNRDRQLAYMREFGLRRYGLTVEQYDEMLERQGHVCGICGKGPSGKRRLAVDHDHETGGVRGLLCGECNMGIGKFKDDPELLRAALRWVDG